MAALGKNGQQTLTIAVLQWRWSACRRDRLLPAPVYTDVGGVTG